MGENGRANLVRALHAGYEIRDDGDADPTLFGHFAVFDRWTEINSWFEGHFLERIAPGAFRKTFRENRDRIRALFQHGQDPQVGDKPIGSIDELREDDEGAYYEVSLFRGLPDLIMEGLRSKQYGASFRFEVMREEREEKPKASEHNPSGLAERTLKELRLFEFGPVTFPAYAEASAGVRSLTDHFLFEQIARDPDKVRALLAVDLSPPGDDAPSTTDAGDTSTSVQERRASRDYLSTDPKEVAWRL